MVVVVCCRWWWCSGGVGTTPRAAILACPNTATGTSCCCVDTLYRCFSLFRVFLSALFIFLLISVYRLYYPPCFMITCPWGSLAIVFTFLYRFCILNMDTCCWSPEWTLVNWQTVTQLSSTALLLLFICHRECDLSITCVPRWRCQYCVLQDLLTLIALILLYCISPFRVLTAWSQISNCMILMSCVSILLSMTFTPFVFAFYFIV